MSCSKKFQVVIWRDGNDLFKDPEVLLSAFRTLNTEYRCFAEHAGTKSGRLHYHCYCRFKNGRHKDQMIRKFGQNVRVMNGDDFDNSAYISEKGTNTTFTEEGHKKRKHEQSTAIVVDEYLRAGESVLDIAFREPELRGYIQQNKWVLREVERRYREKRAREDYGGPENMYPWQRHVIQRIESAPHPRHIHWYMDTEGDVGKTELADWLEVHKDAVQWKPIGKDDDCTNALLQATNNTPPNIIVCDLPAGKAKDISWAAVEQAKNGKVSSNKYQSGRYFGKRPHILIFSNENPTGAPLTCNRLVIHKIKDKEVVEETVY